MNVIRHFSDTRTEVGRVRFLTSPGRVELVAEGPGWAHRSVHADLSAAALYLAWLPQVPQHLYDEALRELTRRLDLEQAA